jgi:hypothetical protein
VVITGKFEGGQTDFGGGPLINAGAQDIYLVGLDAGGNHLFSHSFGTASSERGDAVALDSAGHVLLAGWGPTSLDFGGGPVDGECFLARLNADGEHVWSLGFDVDCSSLSLSLNSANEVLLGGTWSGPSADFGGGPLESKNVFAARFDAVGNHLWSKELDDDVSNSMPKSKVLQDSQGNIYWYVDRVVKLDHSGNQLWATNQFGWSHGGGDMAVDPSGTVAIACDTGDGDFGGGYLSPGEEGGEGCWPCSNLASYDPAGNHLWSMIFDAPGGRAVAIGGDGSVVFAGGGEE